MGRVPSHLKDVLDGASNNLPPLSGQAVEEADLARVLTVVGNVVIIIGERSRRVAHQEQMPHALGKAPPDSSREVGPFVHRDRSSVRVYGAGAGGGAGGARGRAGPGGRGGAGC